jgi:hypothetical protein
MVSASLERFDSNNEFNQSQVVNMFKKLALSIPAAALLLGSSMAMADDTRENITIQLKADIPTANFHVRQPSGEDFTKEQILQWNLDKRALESWNNHLEVKNTAGAIQAKLDNEAKLIGPNGKNIGLTVKVNNIEVNTASATEVVTEADAKPGRKVDFVIQPGAGTDPGIYTGTVALIFEPVATAP